MVNHKEDDRTAEDVGSIKRGEADQDGALTRRPAPSADDDSAARAFAAPHGGGVIFSPDQTSETLRSLAKLIHSLLKMPVAIWLVEFPTYSLRIHAAEGLPDGYAAQVSAEIGDGSVVSRVVETGVFQGARDLRHDRHYGSRARESGWVSVQCAPVKLRGQVCGVIEVFSFKGQEFGAEEMERLRHLADITRVTVESVYYSLGSLKLARIARNLSAVPDLGRAMQVLVENACELTGADSGTIIVWDRHTDSLMIGARAPAPEDTPVYLPRSEGGLTRMILNTGEAVRVDDTTGDPRIREDVLKEGTLSLIGVRVQMEEERIGVLYVNGRREAQFTDYDVRMLQTLADYASVALGWARMLLKPAVQMGEATTNLFNLGSVLRRVGKELRTSQDFHFVALQLTRRPERIVETVYGTGIAETWGDLAWKHYLEKRKSLRDIQADVALNRPPRVEIIAGWDERFDRWIYDEYGHNKLTRIFVPMVVVRDESGRVVDDWLDRCEWKVIPGKEVVGGYSLALEMSLPGVDDDDIEVIGTVEAGYIRPIPDNVVEPERSTLLAERVERLVEPAKELCRLTSLRALEIWRARMPHLLQTVTQCAMRIVGADSASLHFPYDARQRRYVYEVSYGQIGRRFLKEYQPRSEGLGEQAVREGKTMFIPDLSLGHEVLALERLNPKVFEKGIKAIAAFPLVVNQSSGVLYVHFQRQHLFTQDEIDRVQMFVNWAVDAIGHYVTYRQMRERARQLSSLHSVVHSLVSKPEEKNLLRHVAWNTLNTLGADVVTIYEYSEKENQFLIPPAVAGRLREGEEMNKEIHEGDAPAQLVKRGREVKREHEVKSEHEVKREYNVYEKRAVKNPLFNGNAGKRSGDRGLPFVIRERVHSSAGTLLMMGGEIVGVMFVNYRRPHDFSEEDINTIEILSGAASIIIKHRRLLDTITEVFGSSVREIITTLDLGEVLRLVSKRAKEITRADLGAVSRLDPATQELVLGGKWPDGEPIEPSWTRIKMGEGLSGWVAAHKKSALVNDLRADERHKPFFARDGSALCVPLQDKDGHVLGVLGVKSHDKSAFDRSDQSALEVLANYAVIAIRNAENQKRLVAAETFASLGEFATQMVHWMKGEVGLIQAYAQEIQSIEGIDERGRQTAIEIQTLARATMKEALRLKSPSLTAQEAVDLSEAVSKALSRVHVPPDIKLRIELPEDMPRVKGHGWQLTDVFVNLIQNAVDAMPEGGTLAVSSESLKLEGDSWVIIRLRDTGAGIPPENLGKIFQLGYSTKKGEGRSGFGLWWTQTYVERLGGELTVEGQLEEGTQFTLRLPAQEAAGSHEEGTNVGSR